MTTINDGFEGGFYRFQGEGELECPNGWVPVWRHDATPGVLNRPEYKPAGAAQVRSGSAAAAIHSRFSSIDGALVRTVSTERGDLVQASVWMLKTEDGDGHGMQIGIDPTGGTLLDSAKIEWSDWFSQYEPDYARNAWRQRQVVTYAESNLMTVFLRSKVDVATDGTNAHFDDVVIEVEESESEPEPGPGTETLTVELYINGDSVFSQTYRAKVTSVVLEPLGGIVAQLMRIFRR